MPTPSQNSIPAGKTLAARHRESIVLIILTVAGLIIFAQRYDTTRPSTRFQIEIGRTEAVRIAEIELRGLGFHAKEVALKNVSFRTSAAWSAFLQTEVENPNELVALRPEAWWDVVLSDPSREGLIRVLISPSGDVFSIDRPIGNEEEGAHLSSEEAQAVASGFLQYKTGAVLNDWALLEARIDRHEGRSDHTLTWQTPIDGESDSFLRISAIVAGDAVRSWTRGVELSDAFQARFDAQRSARTLFNFGLFVVIILTWVAALVLFAIRFRSGEIGVKNGFLVVFGLIISMIWFLFTTAPFAIHSAIVDGDLPSPRLVMYLGLGFQIFFSAMGLFFVWNAGDSVTREAWPAKLRAFDQLLSQRLFTRDIGTGILRGLSMAAISLGIWHAIFPLVQAGRWSIVADEELLLFSAMAPFGMPLAISIASALLTVAYVHLFGLGGLRLRLGRIGPAVAIMAIVMAYFQAEATPVLSLPLTFVVSLPVGLVSFYFFLRHDLWTVFAGLFFSGLLLRGSIFLAHPAFESAGLVSMALAVGFVGYGLLAALRGSTVESTEIAPPYVRFISERQRLKLELDIARQAQLRMLPSTLPRASGLDVAAFSEPATEVGGDYFDFMEFPDGRLGVVVGDVSGKGMPAALYMTMLKGYLQSRSETDSSPLSALAHVNRMFGQSSDRSMFATMAYCILDVQQSQMTFARAGHCPIIVFRPSDSSTYVLQPAGIGIGLERGDLFERVTVEESMELRVEDTVVLFSDGLTEARDTRGDEFGQQRLLDVLRTGGGSAESVLQKIRAAHAAFVGDSPPHDDLTCVVVRLAPHSPSSNGL